jgi:hypothetical protein
LKSLSQEEERILFTPFFTEVAVALKQALAPQVDVTKVG